jgi:hypothetical protein
VPWCVVEMLEDGGMVSINCFLIAPKNAFKTRIKQETHQDAKNKDIKM